MRNENVQLKILKKNHRVFDKNTKYMRNKVDVRFVTDAKKYQELMSKSCFFPQKIFSRNLVIVRKIKEVSTLHVIIMSRTSFRVNPNFVVCLNVKELLARRWRYI